MRTEAQPKGGRVVAPLYNEGWPVYNTNHSYGDLKCPKLDKKYLQFPAKNTLADFPAIIHWQISRQNRLADFPPKYIGKFPAKINMRISLN